jgi:hypothetical protein
MKLKNKFLSTAFALPLAAAGLMVSCEDTCVDCNCENYKVTSVSSSDSINTALGEMFAEQTVVIKGTGLASTQEIYLADSVGTLYPVALNPAFVTNNNIIVTMKSDADLVSTESIVLVSGSGCRVSYAIAKPVAAPSFKLFYSEFVPAGDTLRVWGSAFLSELEKQDTLKLWFEAVDENGNPNGTKYPIADSLFKVYNNFEELRIFVEEGLPENLKLAASNSHGTSYSSMLFRDTRNVWLDFDSDTTHAGGSSGALATFDGSKATNELTWDETSYAGNPGYFDNVMSKIGGKFPAGCDGLYTVLTNGAAPGANFNRECLVYLTPFTMDPARPKRNLMGPWAESKAVEDMVLKFEVYIPKDLPWGSYAYAVFSAYASESPAGCTEAYGFSGRAGDVMPGNFSRDLTKSKNGQTLKGELIADASDNTKLKCLLSAGVPAAWLHMGSFTVDEKTGTGSFKEAFHTKDRWMTVAIPLTHGEGGAFMYDVSCSGIITGDAVSIHCGGLKSSDFYNFFLHMEDGYSCQTKVSSGNESFVAVDNFRIVPEDNGGARFSKYNGIIPSSRYPY